MKTEAAKLRAGIRHAIKMYESFPTTSHGDTITELRELLKIEPQQKKKGRKR